jgi:hypothetical protein
MLQVRKEYIKFGLAKWGLLFVERGVKIAVVERGVSPTDSVYTPIVGHTYILQIEVKTPCAFGYIKKRDPWSNHLLVLLTASLALPASPAPHFCTGARSFSVCRIP